LSDVCSKYIGDKYDEIIEDIKRIFNKCKGVGQASHNEIFKVISELHGVRYYLFYSNDKKYIKSVSLSVFQAMKTYHEYQSESKQAEAKLTYVQSQKPKYEKTKSQKKIKQFEKQVEKV
jgi:hypothetical protein